MSENDNAPSVRNDELVASAEAAWAEIVAAVLHLFEPNLFEPNAGSATGLQDEHRLQSMIRSTLLEVEKDGIALLMLPEERRERAQRALQAQVLGLLELGRLRVNELQRAMILASIRTAFHVLRSALFAL